MSFFLSFFLSFFRPLGFHHSKLEKITFCYLGAAVELQDGVGVVLHPEDAVHLVDGRRRRGGGGGGGGRLSRRSCCCCQRRSGRRRRRRCFFHRCDYHVAAPRLVLFSFRLRRRRHLKRELYNLEPEARAKETGASRNGREKRSRERESTTRTNAVDLELLVFRFPTICIFFFFFAFLSSSLPSFSLPVPRPPRRRRAHRASSSTTCRGTSLFLLPTQTAEPDDDARGLLPRLDLLGQLAQPLLLAVLRRVDPVERVAQPAEALLGGQDAAELVALGEGGLDRGLEPGGVGPGPGAGARRHGRCRRRRRRRLSDHALCRP